ncbi:MAG: class I SAM-dependent DNA methyltransferase [Sulfuricella sp.]
MDSGQLNSLLKRLCKILWEAQVTNPITYVTQLSYLLFLKMLEEMDAEQKEVGNGKHKTLFSEVTTGSWGKVDFEPMRWSVLTSNPDNTKMLATLRDTLPKLAEHPLLSQGARAIFHGATVVIPDGATLRRLTDALSPLALLAEDADIKGDLFEMLANDLGGQKKAAQFRTPRHLIRVITQMVDPKIGQTIVDPACGTGGFLIAAYEHILLANTSPDFVREVESPYGGKVRRGVGDKLKRAQWNFMQTGALHGFDGDADILRMAAMNAVLHGFDASPIVRRDSICGSEDKWDEVQFDVILENPPFSGARSDAKPSLRLEKGDKYVLFLAHAQRSLRQGGRAGIIFPNGILFGDTGSHIEVKKRLLDKFDLQAVVMLPKGMFEPYTPNPTCFLIFANNGKSTESVWFYRVQGDGSTLTKARKFGPQYRNDFPDLLAKWPARVEEPGCAWRVPVQTIRDNNYNMTLSGLGLIEPDKTEHEAPEEILERVTEKQERVLELLEEMRLLLLEEAGNGAD